MTEDNPDDGGTVGSEKDGVAVYVTPEQFVDGSAVNWDSGMELFAERIVFELDDGELILSSDTPIRARKEPSPE